MANIKSFNNKEVSVFLRATCGTNWNHVPHFIDDIITGLSRSGRGKKPANRGYLLKVLCDLPEITTGNIVECLSDTNRVKKGTNYSLRSAQELGAMARVCSTAILNHIKKDADLADDLEFYMEDDRDFTAQQSEPTTIVNAYML